MTQLSFTSPTIGQPNSTEDVDIKNALDAIKTWANNKGIDTDVVASSLLEDAGISESGIVRRGVTVIATEESTASTSYTKLTTPDQVSSIVLPSNGLLFVGYQALWKNTVSSNSRAGIFLGANQVKYNSNNIAAPAVVEAPGGATTGNYQPLHTNSQGLFGAGTNTTASGSDVTTGQVIGNWSGAIGGYCAIFAAAGTYDVSIQYKNNAAGTLTAKERKLWVWTMGF